MTEYDNEPIRGLPGLLPPGERILWQGSPDRRALAHTAFHTRLVAGYFVVLSAVALGFAVSSGGYAGVVTTAALGIVGVVLLHLLAWGCARTTVYTLTNRRIVLRIGMAIPKCVNLPLGTIGAVGLAARANGLGDLPLTIAGQQTLGYLALWPHARPWAIVAPQPMLRAVPDAAAVAQLIARTCLAAAPEGQPAVVEPPRATSPAYARAVAA